MFKSKISKNPRICQLLLHFEGMITQSVGNISLGLESFYSSNVINAVFEDAYFGKGSFSFVETSSEQPEGASFQQRISFKFPSNDHKRAERIAKAHEIIAVELVLSDGRSMLIGRNDYTQNAPVNVATRSDLGITTVEIANWSESPSSFMAKDVSYTQFYGGKFGEAVYT